MGFGRGASGWQPKLLAKMSEDSRLLLADDLKRWGETVNGMTRREICEATGLTTKRAERLRAALVERQAAPIGLPAGKRTGKTIVVIGDAHTGPGDDRRRWRWLGRFVKDLNPDAVVSLGDWNDHLSLCSQESLREKSRVRLSDEVEAGELAVVELEAEWGSWAGDKHLVLGNHDVRPDKLSNEHPWLEGLIDVGGAHRKRGWTVTPFLDPLRLHGVRFQHYLTSAGTSRPISGKFHSLRMLERLKFSESVVVGHSHRLDYRIETDHIGGRRHSLVAGCFFERNLDYAGEDCREWTRGVMVLHDTVGGDFDLEVVSMRRLRALYG